jgi:hypothetical protein
MRICHQATITHVACEALATMPNLTRLDVRECTQLSERAIAALARSRTLAELRISAPREQNAGESGARLYGFLCANEAAELRTHTALLAQLVRCRTLRMLDLAKSGILQRTFRLEAMHAGGLHVTGDALALAADRQHSGNRGAVALDRRAAAIAPNAPVTLFQSTLEQPRESSTHELRQFHDACEAERRRRRQSGIFSGRGVLLLLSERE